MSLNSIPLLSKYYFRISCSFSFVSQALCRCLFVAVFYVCTIWNTAGYEPQPYGWYGRWNHTGYRPTSNVTIQSIEVAAYLAKFYNSAALETKIQRLLNCYRKMSWTLTQSMNWNPLSARHAVWFVPHLGPLLLHNLACWTRVKLK